MTTVPELKMALRALDIKPPKNARKADYMRLLEEHGKSIRNEPERGISARPSYKDDGQHLASSVLTKQKYWEDAKEDVEMSKEPSTRKESDKKSGNMWNDFLVAYSKKHGISFKEAMIRGRKDYHDMQAEHSEPSEPSKPSETKSTKKTTSNPWNRFLLEYSKAEGISFKEAMKTGGDKYDEWKKKQGL